MRFGSFMVGGTGIEAAFGHAPEGGWAGVEEELGFAALGSIYFKGLLPKNSQALQDLEQYGARGKYSERPFDPAQAGGPIHDPPLSTDGVTITADGVQSVEQHLSRFADFADDEANQGMIDRLRQIATGTLEPTQYDLNFYTHELDEYQRYSNFGWPTGEPEDRNLAHTLWENAHTAALEDYGLPEMVKNADRSITWALYHPDFWSLLGI